MSNYRQLHEDSLRQNRPDLHRDLKCSGELKAHLDEIAQSAKEMHARIVKQMAEWHPYNPVEWENSREAWEGALERTAQEFVLSDRVLVPDEETERGDAGRVHGLSEALPRPAGANWGRHGRR